MKKLYLFLITMIFANCGGDHGTLIEINGGELYYTSSISTREAYKLGEYLEDSGFFDGERKTVQINKTGNTYEFRMVVKKGLENDEEFIQLAKLFSIELSEEVFNGYDVDVHLCDINLETLRVVVVLTSLPQMEFMASKWNTSGSNKG